MSGFNPLAWLSRQLSFGGGPSNQPVNYGNFGSGVDSTTGEPMSTSGYGLRYTPQTPGVPDSSTSEFGLNMDTAKFGLEGLRAIGNLYGGFQASNLANKQFNFAKDYANTNLVNQIKSYNTRLEDRANSRASYLADTAPANYARDYVDQNKLSRTV